MAKLKISDLEQKIQELSEQLALKEGHLLACESELKDTRSALEVSQECCNELVEVNKQIQDKNDLLEAKVGNMQSLPSHLLHILNRYPPNQQQWILKQVNNNFRALIVQQRLQLEKNIAQLEQKAGYYGKVQQEFEKDSEEVASGNTNVIL